MVSKCSLCQSHNPKPYSLMDPVPLEIIAHDYPSKGCVRSVPKENNFTCRTHVRSSIRETSLKVGNGILHDVLVVGYYITDHNRLFRS